MAIKLNVISQFDSKGLEKARKELEKLANSTKTTQQKVMAGSALVGGAIIGTALSAGGALFKMGDDFDAAFDKIRINTGATGPALDALKENMKNVATAVPASFGDASTAVSEFNRRLGLTGEPLQGLSEQVLELSRLTKTDLNTNIAAVSDVMNNFGVTASDQGAKLDVLFRASQQSGVSVADLAGQMSGAGVVLRDVGLSFDQSAALLATLGKAGVDVSDVMPAMSKTLAVAAKHGQDASTVFAETFNTIKNAPNDTAAAADALAVFGAKAGPKMASLIREGKVSYEDLAKSLGSGDGILKAGSDTEDFGEKLTKLKNKVFVALEPIATKVFNKIGEVMDKLGPKIEQLTKWFQEHKEVAKLVAIVIGGVLVGALAAFTVSLFAAGGALAFLFSPITLIAALIAALVAGVIYAWNNFGWFKTAVLDAWEAIKTAALFAWNNVLRPIWDLIVMYIQDILIPGWKLLWEIAKAVFAGIGDAVSFAWNNIISPVFDFIVEGVKTVVGWFNTIKDGVVSAFGGIVDLITTPFKTAFNLIADAWNNTVGSLTFKVPDWIPIIGGKSFEVPKLPHFDTGGMFRAAGGGAGLAVLHDGEVILNSKQQQMILAGGGGGTTINIHMPPGSDGASVVEAIRKYERMNGTGWRN
jgi:TP901 family phage tail tape measure protein